MTRKKKFEDPWSHDSEQGVLSCCFQDPECLSQTVAQCSVKNMFYDIRHSTIFDAMKDLHAEHMAVDMITVMDKLKDIGKLEPIGGMVYLQMVENASPSPLNLPTYMRTLWSKYLARDLIQQNRDIAGEAYAEQGVSEPLLARAAQRFQEFIRKTQHGLEVEPQRIKRPSHFKEQYMDFWFKHDQATFGKALPFEFPMRIRPAEMTIFTGDNGSGKSSMISQIALSVASQRCDDCFLERNGVMIASMEVPTHITMWIMARQLLGVGRLDDNEDGRSLALRAFQWIDERFLFYDFLGIAEWPDVLESFRYASKNYGVGFFVVDSIMRLGITEDDYAQQALVSKEFSDFAIKSENHLMVVAHQNKSDAKAKNRVAGSKKWTDNAHVIIEMQRNEAKGEKMDDAEEGVRVAYQTSKTGDDREKHIQRAIDKKDSTMETYMEEWDARFIMHKQRFPGSRQNGSRRLWFDRGSLQFRDHYENLPVAALDEYENQLEEMTI